MKHYRRWILLIAIVGFGITIGSATDIYRSISTNLRQFHNVAKYLLSEYVDEIDSEELMQDGINGMLEDLDPYTVYIKEEDQTSVDMLTQGKYGGVGIRLGVRNDTLTVIAPMEGTPANRAGIRPGDKIIKIDSKDAVKLRSDEAARKIRGKPGTNVILTFIRYGEKSPFDIQLTREEIDINDMPYYGVEDGIGYVRLNRFSRDTAAQFRAAVVDLTEQGMEGLVVDLRDNPGGLLQDAVVMVDALVAPGLNIVETRGRTKKAMRKYISEKEPVLNAEIPLVILVNEGSASASEIVAGAIQDLDRGVIIGERTFGKGLVQSIFPVGRNTSLKITTAKYYIPSGRLIQKEDYLHNGVLTDGLDKKDSLFVTKGGRNVQGGGGIVPDIEIESEQISPLVSKLLSKSQFFAFATQHRDRYNLTVPITISDDIMDEFREYVEGQDIQVMYPGQKEMETFQTSLDNLESFEGRVDLGELTAYYEDRAAQAFNEEYDQLHRLLSLQFAELEGGIGERIHSALKDDPVYVKTVEILTDQEAYGATLNAAEQTAQRD
ncbi:S41 family peptidase [Candidatus Neomarinimicrobiota bacterium]